LRKFHFVPAGHVAGLDDVVDMGGIGPSPGQTETSINNQIIEALALEYQSLRDELLTRTTGRFQFLGLTATAAALLVSGIGGTGHGLGLWPSVGLAVAVLGLGLGNFFNLGRDILRLSARIAQIEQRINGLLPVPGDGQDVLIWETNRQQRSLFERAVLGRPFTRRR
jgi:hypothetical protein